MSDECVAAVYDTIQNAENAVQVLDRADLPTEQIAVVSTGLADQQELVEELKMGDDSLYDAAIGAGLGGLIGVLSGLTVASLAAPPTLIFFIGAHAGVYCSITGAILGGLNGYGVHSKHIEHYEQIVKAGKVLIVVHGSPLELAKTERLLKEGDALEVHVHAKTSAEAPEVQTL